MPKPDGYIIPRELMARYHEAVAKFHRTPDEPITDVFCYTPKEQAMQEVIAAGQAIIAFCRAAKNAAAVARRGNDET